MTIHQHRASNLALLLCLALTLAACNAPVRPGTPAFGPAADFEWEDDPVKPLPGEVALPDASPADRQVARQIVGLLGQWGSPVPPARELTQLARQVRGQIRFLTTEWKSGYARALDRGVKYRPMIRSALKKRRVPTELSYLPLMESAYKFRALSPAKARGLWQFMPATGRAYGLYGRGWDDDRLDPLAATQAASRHLHDLIRNYQGDVMLALAAYNAGEPRVNRAIRATGGTRRFTAIASRLAPETRAYVPRFLAVVIVAKDPRHYGVRPPREAGMGVFRVHRAASVDGLARSAGISVAKLRDLNDDLGQHRRTPPISNYLLRVPSESVASISERFDLIKVATKGGTASDLAPVKRTSSKAVPRSQDGNAASQPKLRRIKVASSKSREYRHDRLYYEVQSGDTLGEIAQWFQTDTNRLRKANPRDTRGRYLTVGSRLLIHTPSTWTSRTHTVRRGESYGRLARRFGISVSALRKWNRHAGRLSVGERLTVYHPLASAGPWYLEYRVEPGNTLSDIAALLGVSTRDLRRWNGIKGGHLRAGRTLHVYPWKRIQSATYQVKHGDDLGRIASRIGISLNHLVKANGISNPNQIRPGRVLRYYAMAAASLKA